MALGEQETEYILTVYAQCNTMISANYVVVQSIIKQQAAQRLNQTSTLPISTAESWEPFLLIS